MLNAKNINCNIKRSHRSSLAFTLSELLVASSIFVMIAIGVLAVLTAGRRYWQVGIDYIYLQQQARLAMDKMSNELSKSKPGDDYGAVHIAPEFEGANYGQIIDFKIPTLNSYEAFYSSPQSPEPITSYFKSDGTINWGGGALGTTDAVIRYRLDSNKLLREAIADNVEGTILSTTILADYINEIKFTGESGSGTSLSFVVDNPQRVFIEIVFSKQTIFKDNLTYVQRCAVGLRN